MAKSAGSLLVDIRAGIANLRSDLEKGKGQFQQFARDMNKIGDLAKATFAFKAADFGIDALRQVSQLLGETLNRGEQFNTVSAAFDNVGGSIDGLRQSVGGLLSDLELMKRSNLATALGVTPKMFQELAASAESLGEAVGKDLSESLQLLTEGFGRAQDKALKQLGINIDVEKAERAYAKTLGVTREQLSEVGRQEAFRAEAIQVLRQRLKEVGEAEGGAADAFDRLQAAIANFGDQAAAGVDHSQELATVLNDLATIVSALDAETVSTFFAAIVQGAANAFPGLTSVLELMQRLNHTLAENVQQSTLGSQVGSILNSATSAEDLVGVQTALVAKYNERIKALGELYQAEGDNNEAIEREMAALKDVEKQMSLVGAAMKDMAGSSSHTREELINHGKVTEDLAKKQKAAAEQTKKLKQELEKALASNNAQSIQKQFSDALSKGNFAAAQSFLDAYKPAMEALAKEQTEKFEKEFPEQAKALKDAMVKDAYDPMAQALEEKQKEAFQKSVDFFADILTTTITGSAQDLEDILMDALKRVAIGFASQILATLAQAAGINVGAFGGSAQGFGAALANTVLSALGQQVIGQTLGSAIGSTSGGVGAGAAGYAGTAFANAGAIYGNWGSFAAGYSGELMPGALGAAGANASTYGGAASAYTAGSAAAALGTAAGVAGGVYGGYQLYGNAMDNTKDPYGGAAAGAALGAGAVIAYGAAIGSAAGPIGTAIGAIVGAIVGLAIGMTGGTTDVDTLKRRSVKEALAENTPLGDSLTFQGAKGPISLAGISYDDLTPEEVGASPSLQFANQLSKPFASLVSGGDSKLKEDFSSIFTQAIGSASNFVEVLINAQGLLEGMGMTAQDLKQGLADAFLDGTGNVETFKEEIMTANMIASDSLQGLEQIHDALTLIGDDATVNRTKLKALELIFKELAENGITSAQGIVDYMTATFGPEIGLAFQALTAAGVTSFEQIKGASIEQMILIFETIEPFLNAIAGKFLITGQKAGEGFSAGLKMIISAADEVDKRLSKLGDSLVMIGNIYRGLPGLDEGDLDAPPPPSTGTGAGSDGGTSVTTNALGNVIGFASGGVFMKKHSFRTPGGHLGVLGEAGPEAILPLRRINGRLGVSAEGMGGGSQINIVVNAPNAEPGMEYRIMSVMQAMKDDIERNISDVVDFETRRGGY